MMMKKPVHIFLLILLLTTLVDASDIFINEFLASNDHIIKDPEETSEYPDWIEIYNQQDHEINIGGYYLSDNLNNLNKWQIPNGITIAARHYLNVLPAENCWTPNTTGTRLTSHTS